jgi:Tol biopolymer transport system component
VGVVPRLLLLLLLLVVTAPAGGATYKVSDLDPVFSPDGRTIAFVRSYGTHQSLMLIDADGRHLRTLASNVFAQHIGWSRDGHSLVYDANPNIWRIDLADPTPYKLTDESTDVSTTDESWQPAWSPDGTQIAYGRFERCFRCTGIWVMNADGSNKHEVIQDGRRPQWSPDGTKLAFSGGSVLVTDLQGDHLVEGRGNYAVWSPHGTYVAYTGAGLYLHNMRTGGTRRLSAYVGAKPAWAPDGAVLAAGSGKHVVLLRARNGRIFARFPNSNIDGGYPTWSPERIVAYVEQDNCGIDIAREDGTHIRRLTHAC